MKIIHDRIAVRYHGLYRGCRFCQAGSIYRPVRERSPERILKIIEDSLKATGYEDVSLVSLSTGDYTCLSPLYPHSWIDIWRRRYLYPFHQ